MFQTQTPALRVFAVWLYWENCAKKIVSIEFIQVTSNKYSILTLIYVYEYTQYLARRIGTSIEDG